MLGYGLIADSMMEGALPRLNMGRNAWYRVELRGQDGFRLPARLGVPRTELLISAVSAFGCVHGERSPDATQFQVDEAFALIGRDRSM
jgi:hypothetical protein